MEKLTRVDKMMRSLREMLENLGEIARQSKDGIWSWRGESFLKGLRSSNLEKGSIHQTLRILEMQGQPNPDKRNDDWSEDAEKSPSFSVVNVKSDPLATTKINDQENDDNTDDSRGYDNFVDENDSEDQKSGAEDSEDWPIVNEDDDGQPNAPGENDKQNEDYIKSEIEVECIISSSDEYDEELRLDSAARKTNATTSRQLLSNPSRIVVIANDHNPAPESNKLIKSTQKCDLCKVIVPIEKIRKHFQEHIGDDYILHCPNQTCPFIFGRPWFLYAHLIGSKTCGDSVPDLNQYKNAIRICEVCGFQTGNALKLSRHLLQDHENDTKNYSCPVKNCEERFTVKQSVVLHLPHHEFCRDVTSQRCDQCNKQIKLEEMAGHLRDNHQVEEVIKCNQCSFLFSTRQSLIDHMFQHRFSVLSCDICNDGVNYGQHSKLRDHYFLKHQIGQKHPCGICNHMCWTKEGLITHRKEHHNDKPLKPPKMYKCDECDAEFARPVGVRDHKIVFHGAEPLRCKFCGEKFTRRLLYQRHIKEHLGIPMDAAAAKRYPCEWKGCTKIFATKKGREYHLAAAHIGEKNFHCDMCDKSFAVPSGLSSHKNTAHSDVRPHVCDVCGEGFKLLATLKTHKLIHTAERQFACELCGQRFRHKVALSTHLKGHQKKGDRFKPKGPMKNTRKRVERKN